MTKEEILQAMQMDSELPMGSDDLANNQMQDCESDLDSQQDTTVPSNFVLK